LRQKWEREFDYALRKDLWAFEGNRIAVPTSTSATTQAGNGDAAPLREGIEAGGACLESRHLANAGEQLMVHVAHEDAMLLGQGVDRAVAHGDEIPRHAWLVAVASEQVDQARYERRPSEELGSEAIAALGHGDAARWIAIGNRRGARAERNLGERRHRNRPLAGLALQARSVARIILERAAIETDGPTTENAETALVSGYPTGSEHRRVECRPWADPSDVKQEEPCQSAPRPS